MPKAKTKNYKLKFRIIHLALSLCILIFVFWATAAFCQKGELEVTLDINSNTFPLSKIFKPNIDLSGRGIYKEDTWPQGLAAPEVLDLWQKDIGLSGIYRLQYNLWEIGQTAKDKEGREKLLLNYEATIKKISDAGGIVILDIFGTPAGLGNVLDKRSPVRDIRAFKALIKELIKELSCNKRYNIWYEVWSAPDLDEFFLGRKQEYLNLYRAVAEVIRDLEKESKIYIPLGGPATSWWFQNCEGNSIIAPEKSLIYELIKFCRNYRLPLDFISWHAYSTDPKVESELTRYNKKPAVLIRDWLSYFNFDRDTPLIVDEWNYDSGANLLAERKEKSFVTASYIPSRMKRMSEAGLDYQLFFALEDFHNRKEGVVRNMGVFWSKPDAAAYEGAPKVIYNVLRMLANLGEEALPISPKIDDEFIGVTVTKKEDKIVILIANYIDPEIFVNYLSRNIALFNEAQRKALLNLVKSNKIEKIKNKELDINSLRLSRRLKSLLKKAQELNEKAQQFLAADRKVKIGLKNLQGNYSYARYSVDAKCGINCEFAPVETKEINATDLFQETLLAKPYSVNTIILNKKPKTIEAMPANATEAAPVQNTTSPVINTTQQGGT